MDDKNASSYRVSKSDGSILRAPKRAFAEGRSDGVSSGKSNKSRSTQNRLSKKRPSKKRPPKKHLSKKHKTPKQKTGLVAFIGWLSIEVGMVCMTAALGVVALLAYYAADLPSTDSLWRPDRAPRYTILAADGSPLSVQGAHYGAPVSLSQLPPHVIEAVLAVEDRNFHHHVGVNPLSVGRAVLVNTSNGGVVQGGSTITQQLAKNLFLSADKTFKRKVQELLLALWLERRFTKNEILTLYLNRVYLGAGAYGIDAASHRYFGKPATRLSLTEGALIAGLLKAPSRYNPTHNPQDAGERAQLVLENMVAAGFLSKTQAQDAINTPIYLKPSTFSASPYFIDYVLSQVKKIAPDNDADLIIKTSFDQKIQYAAEQGLRRALDEEILPPAFEGEKPIEAAIVIANREGNVLAMIGGRDYKKSQFNRAVQAKRQPGSAFKPFVYLAALEAGALPDHFIMDAPIKIKQWSPDNYKSKFYGEVTLREALSRSLNSATIRLQEWVGRDRVQRTAKAMGFEGPLNPDAALGLGVDAVSPLQLAQSYVPLVNGGLRVKSEIIETIDTVEGIRLYENKERVQGVGASPHAISNLNEMLHSVTENGTGRNARVTGFRVFGKTGTTQNNRDAWFAGHMASLICVVWVGYDDNRPMKNINGGDITGGRAPAKIWGYVMSNIAEIVQQQQSWPNNNSVNNGIENNGEQAFEAARRLEKARPVIQVSDQKFPTQEHY